MKKLSLREITREINLSELAPKKWEFESIEEVEQVEKTAYGKMTKYIVVVRFPVSKNHCYGLRFEINHYEDEDVYKAYYFGVMGL